MGVSIQKIAELCGVSIMTVSRVFNPACAGMVKEETRRRILETAARHNYHPVMIGRSFVSGKTYRIGLILDRMSVDLSSPTFSNFMEAACEELQGHGYTMTLLLAKNVQGRHGENIRELLLSKVADGYIFSSTMIFETMRDALRKTPVVLLASEAECASTEGLVEIRRDYRAAFREIWSMIPSRLRRKVVALSSPSQEMHPRRQAFLSSAPPASKVREFTLYRSSSFLTDWAVARRFAEENFRELSDGRVFWCQNDLSALGVMEVFRARGLEPGKDVRFIGFDNVEPQMPFQPAVLTTIDQRWAEVGRKAASAILRKIDGKPVGENDLVVESTVVKRSSL